MSLDATAITGDLIIGSQRIRGRAGEVIATDPRTGDQLEPSFGLGTEDDVRQATAAAWDAFPAYRETGLEERASFLEQIAENIAEITEPLVARVVQETGIVEPRVRGELARTLNQLRLFASVVREGSWTGSRVDPALPERTPLPRPDIRQRKIALGPVAVFGASNFPLAFSVAGGDTASALAAGCPVVVKAHSAHPGTSELVGSAIQRAVAQHHLPDGVFSLLYGNGRDVGVALVSDPNIRAVGFTGSRSGGVALMHAAAGRPVPIPVYAEMSSINPVFVLPGALASQAGALGQAFVESLTTGVGQLCTNPGLVFAVDGPDLDAFVSSAAAAVSQSAAQPMLNAGICASYTNGIGRLGALEGVTPVAAGQEAGDIAAPGQAHLFTTTARAFLAEPAQQEEVFGASSLVVRLESVDQVAEVVEALEGQLTATVHATSEDYTVGKDLLRQLETKVGRVLFNGWPTGVDVGHAMVHGGPFPATSDGRSTSVGTLAIERFLRPVAYQNVPAELLPAAVDVDNSLGLWRRVDGDYTKD